MLPLASSASTRSWTSPIVFGEELYRYPCTTGCPRHSPASQSSLNQRSQPGWCGSMICWLQPAAGMRVHRASATPIKAERPVIASAAKPPRRFMVPSLRLLAGRTPDLGSTFTPIPRSLVWGRRRRHPWMSTRCWKIRQDDAEDEHEQCCIGPQHVEGDPATFFWIACGQALESRAIPERSGLGDRKMAAYGRITASLLSFDLGMACPPAGRGGLHVRIISVAAAWSRSRFPLKGHGRGAGCRLTVASRSRSHRRDDAPARAC